MDKHIKHIKALMKLASDKNNSDREVGRRLRKYFSANKAELEELTEPKKLDEAIPNLLIPGIWKFRKL